MEYNIDTLKGLNFLAALIIIIFISSLIIRIFFNSKVSWKQAFFATVKKTKFPIFLKIIGYVILFILAGQVLKYLNYEPDFLTTLITFSVLLFVAQFSFILMQELDVRRK